MVTGRRADIKRIKEGISKTVVISDLGPMKRHLGVDYEFTKDPTSIYVRSHMTGYISSIVIDYEQARGSKVKMYSTPGASVTPPLRSTDDDSIVEIDSFRSFIGSCEWTCVMRTGASISEI